MTLDRDRVAAALPSYQIGAELGRGGFGIVLEARHLQLGRDVAIKQLPRAFAADPAVRARFLSEARLLASLDHPHVVPVYDFVEQEGLCLLVMEKLSGGTVWSRFTSEGITMDAACALTLAACAGLHCAHAQGILHRDIKPENLMFSAKGVVKVTDFGIAKILGGSATLATRAGEVMGTPAYMAPEQAKAAELTVATDVYAMGTMLYELLSGKLPFADDGDALALLYRHVHEPPVPLGEVAPQVPAGLAAEVMRSIATDPAARQHTAEAFGVAVAEAATAAWGPGWLGRSDLPVMAAGSMVVATERSSGPPRVTDETGAFVEGGGPMDTVASQRQPVPPAEEHGRQPGAPASAPPAPMRPTVTVRSPGAVLEDTAGLDLVPIHEVIERPAGGGLPALLAVALLALTVVVALATTGDRSPSGNLPGPVTVNGVDVTRAPIRLDLAKPVVLTGSIPPEVPPPTKVALEFSVLGVALGGTSSTVEPGGDGAYTASLDVSGLRYLLASEVEGRLEYEGADGRMYGEHAFSVSTTQPPFLTVPGVATVAVLLFLIAYAESLLRSRRKGRKRLLAPVGLALLGGLAGVVAVALVWIVGGQAPATLAPLVCACLGAAAGIAAGVAAGRVAQSRRFARPRG